MQFIPVMAEAFFDEYSKQQNLLVEIFSDIVFVVTFDQFNAFSLSIKL